MKRIEAKNHKLFRLFVITSEPEPYGMKIAFRCLTVVTLLGFLAAAVAEGGFSGGVRTPVAAGKFYPQDPTKLINAIQAYLDDSVKASAKPPVAILSPHAGYIFSGQICADAFRQASPYPYDVIVLLGTNHTDPGFAGVSIWPSGGYETPLGTVPIDEMTSRSLMQAGADFLFKESVHLPEHSIEVLVPFVQVLFPDAKIVAAIIGTENPDLCSRFGKALADAVKGKRALIVASSDLSHYPEYEDAVRTDLKVLEAVVSLDPAFFLETVFRIERQTVSSLFTCACGKAPILAAMTAARMLGADCARIVSYANSGDTAFGTRDRVVGYGAVVFAPGGPCIRQNIFPQASDEKPCSALNERQKTELLAFSRKNIRQFLTADTLPMARGLDPALDRKQGAFVTLKNKGRLRGCIGHPADDLPLCQVVGTISVQAACNDRRFPGVTLEELPQIDIEISILTPFQPVEEAEKIVVGRDGVILRKDGRSAVFLPQVAVEQGWNREEMLDRLCLKAGLSEGSWKTGAQFYTFQTETIKEPTR